ncbi:hypothetical protein DW736_02910 [Coprobacillus sp. AM28-15LB]|jgi:hypothetical protein|nr:hypothetical protein DW736_02910 [Coprobacillus sp. AM28-15LB]
MILKIINIGNEIILKKLCDYSNPLDISKYIACKIENDIIQQIEYQNFIEIYSSLKRINDISRNIDLSYLLKYDNNTFANKCFDFLEAHNLIDKHVILLLTNSDFCNKQFSNFGKYSILKEIDTNQNIENQLKDSGNSRYYKNTRNYLKKTYAISNNWFYNPEKKKDNRTPFINWLTKLFSAIKYRNFSLNTDLKYDYNRIIFGAPGTGKSYTLNKDKEDLIKKNENYERVTFHPDYSYANFVGTYKPVNNDNDEISYKYVPGPFLRILVKALESNMNDTPEPFLLIIEEINRANPAAVFGDIFQLLDRNNGVSEYPIHTSEDMKKYISEELKIPADQCAELRIPDNMFIWATMNSADQGVFPMDTAFKRRWNFEYCGINKKEEELNKQTTLDIIINNDPEPIHWNSIRKAINCELTEIKVNEDKQLGPFFLNVNDLMDRYSDNKSKLQEKFNDLFKDKIIMYLFEDAAKQKKDFIFSGIENPRIYSEICKEYDEKGLKIFGEDFTNKVKEFEAKAKSSGDDL